MEGVRLQIRLFPAADNWKVKAWPPIDRRVHIVQTQKGYKRTPKVGRELKGIVHQFLAALAALFLTLVTDSVGATLEF